MAKADIDVEYVAKLARIELTPDEVTRFGGQLATLLEYVAQLEALPTSDVAATAQVIPSTGVARDDVARPSLDRETVLSAAPQRQGFYVRVPRIIGEAQ